MTTTNPKAGQPDMGETPLPGKFRSQVTRPDLYAEIDELQQTVFMAATRLAEMSTEIVSLQSQLEAAESANAALMAERASLIETKREQIERLTAERDSLSTIVATAIDSVIGAELDDLIERAEAAEERAHYAEGVAQTNIDRASAAEAERDAMREALEPFALYSWSLRGRRDSEHELGWMGSDEAGEPAEVNLTVGSFRAARKALYPEEAGQ